MKSEILRLLKESEGYLSGQQLCDRFQVSRTAVWKVIEQLKKEGYQIEAVRNKGYRLIDSPDVMSRAEIESLTKGRWAGAQVVYYEETDSTNNRAKEAGDKGCGHGTLFVAERQAAGKGRRPGVGIACRDQYLYDAFAPSGYSAGQGAPTDTSDGGCRGRRNPRGYGDQLSDQMAQ